jgi:2-C-methyl-D-erythritol 4-phosphate cytidylyltransferase
MTEAKVWAVVPAAGKGARVGATTPKQYLQLAGKSVLQYTLELLLGHPRITATALVISADDKLWSSHAHAFGDDLHLAIGGSERCHSVLAGIDALSEIGGESDWVLVHDAARPCLRASDIDRMLTELGDSRWGGILASPVRDTLKRCSDTGEIESTVDRTRLWHALTPQMFRLGTLRDALSRALDGGLIVTDEAQAIEAAGGTPRIVEGHADNIKITHPADLKLAEIYLKIQGRY